MKLDMRTETNLKGVHPDLVKVVRRAAQITKTPFTVIEGMRTKARQEQLVKAGASRTMNSRHLTGHAVDVAALVGGRIRWDWPLYASLADAMKTAAKELGVAIVWGGDWPRFRDGPHFELDRKIYS
jgi:peptidoglycan L-alanyl-D-glutamate endopeptidase CwlK